MIAGAASLFYKSLLFMGTREKNLKWKQHSFHLWTFFCTRSELKYHENFHEGSYDILIFVLETECYCTHKFCTIDSLQDGAKT